MSSRGVNKVILIGHLGQEPKVRNLDNGNVIVGISLATSESWRSKEDGTTKEVTEWHRVVFFGKPAEIAAKYLTTGSQIYVEGQLKTRKWQDKTGQDHYTTEVVVNVGGTLQMLGGKQDGEKKENTPAQHQASNSSYANRHQFTPEANNESPINFDDDIPF